MHVDAHFVRGSTPTVARGVFKDEPHWPDGAIVSELALFVSEYRIDAPALAILEKSVAPYLSKKFLSFYPAMHTQSVHLDTSGIISLIRIHVGLQGRDAVPHETVHAAQMIPFQFPI